jgi:hypothetical protein
MPPFWSPAMVDVAIAAAVTDLDTPLPKTDPPPPKMTSEQIAATWVPEADKLLLEWRNRAYAAQSAYYMMAERFTLWNYLLGVPVVTLSGLVGTAVFSNLDGTIKYGNWVIGSISIIAAILSSLQTFLRLAESATHFGVAADWYSAIRRDAEELLALPKEMRGDAKTALDKLRQEMNKVGQKAPALSERRWAESAQRFSVNEPPLPPRRRFVFGSRTQP